MGVRRWQHDRIVYPDGRIEDVDQGLGSGRVREWTDAWKNGLRSRFNEEVVLQREAASREREIWIDNTAKWRSSVATHDFSVTVSYSLLRRHEKRSVTITLPDDAGVIALRPTWNSVSKRVIYSTTLHDPDVGQKELRPPFEECDLDPIVRSLIDGQCASRFPEPSVVPELKFENWISRNRDPRAEMSDRTGWKVALFVESRSSVIAEWPDPAGDFGVPETLIIQQLNTLGADGWKVANVAEDKAFRDGQIASMVTVTRYLLIRSCA